MISTYYGAIRKGTHEGFTVACPGALPSGLVNALGMS